MEAENFRNSESVDMKNPEAVAYAAEQIGITVRAYKMYADLAGTYHRQALEKFIIKNLPKK